MRKTHIFKDQIDIHPDYYYSEKAVVKDHNDTSFSFSPLTIPKTDLPLEKHPDSLSFFLFSSLLSPLLHFLSLHLGKNLKHQNPRKV